MKRPPVKKNKIVCRCTCKCISCRASSTRRVEKTENRDTSPSEDGSDTSLEIGRRWAKKEVEVIQIEDSDDEQSGSRENEEPDSDSTVIMIRKKGDQKRKPEGHRSGKPVKRTKARSKSPSEVDEEESISSTDGSVEEESDSERSDSEENSSLSDESTKNKNKKANNKRPFKAKIKGGRKNNNVFIDLEASGSDDDEDEDRSEEDSRLVRKTKPSKKRASTNKSTSRNKRNRRKKEASSDDDDETEGESSEEVQGESDDDQDSETCKRETRRRSVRIENQLKQKTSWPEMVKRSKSSISSPRKGNIEFSSESEDDDESDKSCSTPEESEPEDLSKRVCLVCKNLNKKRIVGRSRVEGSEWCTCDKCEVTNKMKDYDRVCCRELIDVNVFRKNEINGQCITKHPRFNLEVLEFRALERSQYLRTDFYGNTDSHMAQWSFRRWIWDKLSSQDRIMVPACVRAKIVKQFPRDHTELFRSAGDKMCCKKIHCKNC